MQRFLTGNLDADRLILMEVDDRELFSICIPKKDDDTYSKYAQKLCNEDFFRNRTFKHFPWTVEYKEENVSWKKYYASLVYYISEMKTEKFMKKWGYKPFDAVKYQGNPKEQYIFFKKNPGESPYILLADAAELGELGIVKYFIENGANVHSLDDFSLRYASTNGYLDMVKYLVERGADIHARDDYALRFASANGHLEVVKFLVEKGADVHTLNDYALKKARENGHIKVVEYLESLNK